MFTHTMSVFAHFSPAGISAAPVSGSAFCSAYATLVGVGAVVAVLVLDEPPPPQPISVALSASDATMVTILKFCIPLLLMSRYGMSRRQKHDNAENNSIPDFHLWAIYPL